MKLNSRIAVFAAALAMPTASVAQAPEFILGSDVRLLIEEVATTPFDLTPTAALSFGGFPSPDAPNQTSPAVVGNTLYTIDQGHSVYEMRADAGGTAQFIKVFSTLDAPAGVDPVGQREAILNVSEGPKPSEVAVMLSSTTPPDGIPIFELPSPLYEPAVCLELVEVQDLYRYGDQPLTSTGDPCTTVPPFIPIGNIVFKPTQTTYQTLVIFDRTSTGFVNGRPVVAFENQEGPTHTGGAMLTLPDGRILYATGDSLPFGAEGRAAAQDDAEIVSKMLIIDPDNGSVELAAKGLRNVQRFAYAIDPTSALSMGDIDNFKRLQGIARQPGAADAIYVGFADIGGVTAEEVNFISLADILDTSVVENFGWGRNQDGLAREGTFYVGMGIPLILGTQPPAEGFSPVPEAGFVQPIAQYGRFDPLGGVAVSGPVASAKSFDTMSMLFTDLSAGVPYFTTGSLDQIAAPVFAATLVDTAGNTFSRFNEVAGLDRVDPRLFRFPDGTAGVLFEATGVMYRLTELP